MDRQVERSSTLQPHRWSVAVFAGNLVQPLKDLKASLRSEISRQFQWTEWVVEAELHRQIDIVRRGQAHFCHVAAEISDHRGHALGDEPWAVVDRRHQSSTSNDCRGRRVTHRLISAGCRHDRQAL